jgi:hypothetical protein
MLELMTALTLVTTFFQKQLLFVIQYIRGGNAIATMRIIMAKTVVEGGAIPFVVKAFNARGREVSISAEALLAVDVVDESVGAVIMNDKVNGTFTGDNPGSTHLVATLFQTGKPDVVATSEMITVEQDNEIASMQFVFA